MRCGNIHISIQDILGTSVQFDGDTNNANLRTVLSSRKIQRREEQVILSTIQCKATDRLPQEGNDETTNLLEHACKVKWYGLHSRDIVSNKYHQHVRGKITHHDQSTGKEATKAVLVFEVPL